MERWRRVCEYLVELNQHHFHGGKCSVLVVSKYGRSCIRGTAFAHTQTSNGGQLNSIAKRNFFNRSHYLLNYFFFFLSFFLSLIPSSENYVLRAQFWQTPIQSLRYLFCLILKLISNLQKEIRSIQQNPLL